LGAVATIGVRHLPLAAPRKTLHHACAQAKGGIIFFLAAQKVWFWLLANITFRRSVESKIEVLAKA
jgi:hypothetical protein